ncbi:MAG TPA: NYN domain-containing protein [Ktedonobacterales bacterium]
MGPRIILIDGYNVIRNIPALAAAERLSLRDGREALLAQVVARYRHTPHRVVVVFDGDGPVETTQPIPRMSRGQIIFTRRGELADAVIQRLAAAGCERAADVVVASNDLEVRMSVEQHGGSSARVDALAARLNEPPAFQRRLAQHRAYVRQQWESAEDDIPPARRGGNPRRTSKRQRTRPFDPLA